jgi:O-antigen ligase
MNVIHSLESSFFYFRYGLFIAATVFLIQKIPNFIRFFGYALISMFIYCLIDGYYQFFFGTNLIGYSSLEESRLLLPLDDRLILGGLLARLFPLIIGMFVLLYGNRKFNYLYVGILLITTDVLIFLTGERTAFGLLIISTLFILFFISKFRLMRIITFIISILLVIYFSFTNEQVIERNFNQTITQLGLDSESEKINILSPQHENMFISAYKIFKERPIFGSGPDSFKILCGEERFDPNPMSCSTHPHNTYVQILTEIGLIGFSMFIFFVGWILFNVTLFIYKLFVLGHRSIDDYSLCLYACIFLSIFPLLPTQDFFNNWISIIYYLPIGFLIHTLLFNKDDQNEMAN